MGSEMCIRDRGGRRQACKNPPHNGGGQEAGWGLLAQLTALHAGAAQHLAVLLLGHALAALLNDGTHGVLTFV